MRFARESRGGWKKVRKKERMPATLWYSGCEMKMLQIDRDICCLADGGWWEIVIYAKRESKSPQIVEVKRAVGCRKRAWGRD